MQLKLGRHEESSERIEQMKHYSLTTSPQTERTPRPRSNHDISINLLDISSDKQEPEQEHHTV